MADLYGQLVKAQLENLGSDPGGTPPTGLMWFNTAGAVAKFYDGTAVRTVATRDATETLTNKTLTSPQVNSGVLLTPNIDNYVDVNEESAPGTPSAGKIRVYGKTDKKLYAKTSAGVESQLGGGGSGSGEVNVVESPNDVSGWSTTGANGPTGATTTTAGDLPLGPIVDTAIQLTSATAAGAEATNYFSYPITMPAALKSRKHKVDVWLRPGTNFISNEWTVSVYAGATRMALSTDSSAVTYLPNATGKFSTTFDADTSTDYTLRFSRPVNAGTNAAVLNVAGVVVGPGIQPQGAVVDESRSYTSVLTASGGGTVAAGTGGNARTTSWYRRVGDFAHVHFEFVWGTSSPTFGTSGEYTAGLPTGLTANLSKIPATSALYSAIGNGMFYDASTQDNFGLTVFCSNTGTIYLALEENTSGAFVGVTSPVTIAAGDQITADFAIPISEWAGSGTVNLAQNDVEYAYNSSTTDASDTTSFAYGPGGGQFGNFTAERLKRVRFQTSIQTTDAITLECTSDGGTTWIPVGQQAALVDPYTVQNTVIYGAAWLPVNSTDVDVDFGTYRRANGATYGGTGSAWSDIDVSSTYKWRLRKASGGQAVGFGLASTTSSGLVSTAAQSFAGAKTFTAQSVFSAGFKHNTFSAYKASGTQAVTTSHVQITFGTEEFDINSNYDTTTSRFTPTIAGKYLVKSRVLCNATAGDVGTIKLIVNGSSSTANNKNGAVEFRTTGANVGLDVSGIIDFNGSTDYVEVFIINSTANTLTVGNGQQDTYFQATLVG